MIKVYDGNNSLRQRIFRVISVPRQATTEQILTLALQAFHITKDPSNYRRELGALHFRSLGGVSKTRTDPAAHCERSRVPRDPVAVVRRDFADADRMFPYHMASAARLMFRGCSRADYITT